MVSKGTFIDDDDVADLLVCTSFINAFGKLLGVSPFNIDQLRDALEHSGESTLLSEVHIVLLRLVIQSMPEDSIEERRLAYLGDLLNGITWPEVLRVYISFWLRYGEYEKLQDKFEQFTREALHDAVFTLGKKQYFDLSTPEKLTVLQFLIDEALETPTIAEYINEHEAKLKELRQEKREDDAEAKREMQRERRHEARRLRGEDSETSEDSSSESGSEDEDGEEEDGEEEDGGKDEAATKHAASAVKNESEGAKPSSIEGTSNGNMEAVGSEQETSSSSSEEDHLQRKSRLQRKRNRRKTLRR